MDLRGHRVAPGGPGTVLGWPPSSKDGFGTAYSADSRIWYTLWKGIVTELYFPRIDRPQIRAVEFAVTDGETFFQDELRHMKTAISRPSPNALAYRVVTKDPEGRYTLEKEVLSAPHHPSLLVRTRFHVHRADLRDRLRLFTFCMPSIEEEAAATDGAVHWLLGSPVLTASRGEVALAIGANVPFRAASAGYFGASDGLTSLARDFTLGEEYDLAPGGSVGLTAEVAVPESGEFVLAVSFGQGLDAAATNLLQTLGTSFKRQRDRFDLQWGRAARHGRPVSAASGDGGALARASQMVLLAHEDKTFAGAFIASPSTPWGFVHSEERGGYHLVWTRDMVQTATALLANGSREAPLRALIYLASRQKADGSFPQNFWIDGRPYWTGLQLDEVALPILLAWRLARDHALEGFDPYPMVLRAAKFLVEQGPVTQQDRWEELSGYSPYTIALEISALLGASEFARRRGDELTAAFLEEAADFLEGHVESWTVTDRGTLEPSRPRHYVRIRPALASDPSPRESGPMGYVDLPNLAPDTNHRFPAEQIVSNEFLALVRYGIRSAHDPTVVDSLELVDRWLKCDTPFGPCWRRYNHDGYGQGPEGVPYVGWGVGRPWPLLTGERGHYELAAGRDAAPYAQAMERFANETGLLTEQIWDEPDREDRWMFLGRPTGAAMPLAWAHAEYLTLLRSIDDGRVFDRIPAVAERYQSKRRPRLREHWKFNRQLREIPPDRPLRVQAAATFVLHWSDDGWRTAHDTISKPTPIGLHFVDLPPLGKGSAYVFTFRWPLADRWEGRDFRVAAAGPDADST